MATSLLASLMTAKAALGVIAQWLRLTRPTVSPAVAVQVPPDCSAESKLEKYQQKTDGKIDALSKDVAELTTEVKVNGSNIAHAVKDMHNCLDNTKKQITDTTARQDSEARDRHAELRSDVKEQGARIDALLAQGSRRSD